MFECDYDTMNEDNNLKLDKINPDLDGEHKHIILLVHIIMI